MPSAKFWRRGKAVFSVVFLGLLFARQVQAASSGPIDTLMGWLASAITVFAQLTGKVVVLFIGGVLMPIAQYNDFVNSPVIGAGWAVVRDSVNMFFVIIFILIAFGTILGIERFKWRQQVPRLLLMAIFINFSRMICGILIDFSQVFMLTFINAVKDIAGGNFIQMFGLNDIMSGTSTANTALTNSEILLSAMVALIMMLIVLVTITFMIIAFLYRIVLLWGLVTIAPLAWFTKSLDGIFSKGFDGYKQWWSKFTCSLIMGPILAFFLWLALAVAGSGSEIAGFDTNGSPEIEIFSAALDPGRLITFIVGIALLVIGLDTANDVCQSADSTMGKILGTAKSTGRAVASAPIAAAGVVGAASARYGLQGAKGLGKWGYRQSVGRGVSAVKDLATDTAGKVAKSQGMPASLRGAASKLEAQGLAGRAARAEQKAKSTMTADQVLTRYSGASLGLGADERLETMARMKQLLGDPSVMNDPAKFAQLQGFLGSKDSLTGNSVMSLVESTFKGDAGFQKQMKDLKKSTPSLFGKDQITEALQDGDWDAVNNLSGSQLSNKDVVARLGQIDVQKKDANGKFVTKKNPDGTDTGEPDMISAIDALKNGQFGRDKKKAWEDGQKALLTSAAATIGSEPEQVAKAVASGSRKDIDAWRDRVKDPNAVLAAGLAGKGSKERASFRQKLASSGLASTTKAFDFREDGRFENDEAKKDFSAAVVADPQVLLQAIRESTEKGGEPPLALVRELSPDVVKKLLKKAKTTTGEEQKKALADLNYVFALVEDKKDPKDTLTTRAINVEATFGGEAHGGEDSSSLIRAVEAIKNLRGSFQNLTYDIEAAKKRKTAPGVHYIAQDEVNRLKEEITKVQRQIATRNVPDGRTLGDAAEELKILAKKFRDAKKELDRAKRGPGIL